jgi:hypothetical protein
MKKNKDDVKANLLELWLYIDEKLASFSKNPSVINFIKFVKPFVTLIGNIVISRIFDRFFDKL